MSNVTPIDEVKVESGFSAGTLFLYSEYLS